MKINRWSLWEFIIARLAIAHGFLDPRALMMKIQRFSRPSEVWVPAELLRSGMTLQARGLINSQAIQNNLDWVWPFWVERQFSPTDPAFIPRAFNLTNINLTCRNWTAVGIPDCSDYAIVDPAGLVMPFFDSWSIDAWIIRDNGFALIPSKIKKVFQHIQLTDTLQVVTLSTKEDASLESTVQVTLVNGIPTCRMAYTAQAGSKAWLLICVRPYNPEGISAVDSIKRLEHAHGWQINGKTDVVFNNSPDKHIFSNYQLGDVLGRLFSSTQEISCQVGMATSAAFFELLPNQSRDVIVDVALSEKPLGTYNKIGWSEHLKQGCALQVPDQLFQKLFETALQTLVLHAPHEVYPGPYTYKRFWFRDAAFILYAMLATGLTRNIEKILNEYPKRQTPTGYFNSQDGEWDSNGQALWTIGRYAAMTGATLSPALLASVETGVRWISHKRVGKDVKGNHAGLLPAGFSAEHFGPSDFYFWDDFWSIAGLKAAASLFSDFKPENGQEVLSEMWDMENSVNQSLLAARQRLGHDGIPASPYRRMDAGSIGSLVASYPLQLLKADDPHILYTVDFLMKNHLLDVVYYHELSHSGINIYLTLHLAQVLLRAGDRRFFEMVRKVAQLATSTGQWPEAIHPQTKGGCMGDGQHVWAAAEWIMIIRNMFVREEERSHQLILCSGIPQAWLQDTGCLLLGPTQTIFGPVTVTVDVDGEYVQVSWQGQWRAQPAAIELRLEGYDRFVWEKGGNQKVRFNKSSRKVES
ncbi:MAG: hypothetical protein JNN05_08845 [Candidatus Omnitrophica bacterium]|nr:hypothetical protein [Candidatus Omnitrophota bacterium]